MGASSNLMPAVGQAVAATSPGAIGNPRQARIDNRLQKQQTRGMMPVNPGKVPAVKFGGGPALPPQIYSPGGLLGGGIGQIPTTTYGTPGNQISQPLDLGMVAPTQQQPAVFDPTSMDAFGPSGPFNGSYGGGTGKSAGGMMMPMGSSSSPGGKGAGSTQNYQAPVTQQNMFDY